MKRDLENSVADPAPNLTLVVLVGVAKVHRMPAGEAAQLDPHDAPEFFLPAVMAGS